MSTPTICRCPITRRWATPRKREPLSSERKRRPSMPKAYNPAGSGRKAQEEGNPLRITVCTTVSPAHIAAIEVARGEQDRATWIRAAILRELDRTNDGKETREMQTLKVWAEVNGVNIFAGDRRAKNAENALRAQAKMFRPLTSAQTLNVCISLVSFPSFVLSSSLRIAARIHVARSCSPRATSIAAM